MKLLNIQSAFLSVLVHAAAVLLLVFSLDFSPEPIQMSMPAGEVMDATAVDSKAVEEEVTQLKELQQKKIDRELELQKKVQELEKKSQTAEQKRRQEEEKLVSLQKQQEEQEKKRKEEEQKLADAQKKQEEMKRQAEIEQKKREEAVKQAEIAKKKKEEEEALKKKQAAEAAAANAAKQAAQDKQDLTIIQQYQIKITSAIRSNFNIVGMPQGLSCVIYIRFSPTGSVLDAKIAKTSGNAVFDGRAVAAVNLASPLPVPEDSRIFNKMREIEMIFKP